MSAQVLALAACACCLVAATGWSLLTTPGPAERRLTPARAAPHGGQRAWLSAVLGRLGTRLAPLARPLITAGREQLMRERVAAAGSAVTYEGYVGAKATWAVLLGTAGLLLANPVMVLALAAVGWLLPDFSVAALVRRRQHRITRDLPDFLDVLTVVVAAGTGFAEALDRVSTQLGGPLAEELRITLAEVDLGQSRKDAFEELRRRNDSEALGSFVGALLQADELGVPLARTLTEISGDMRRMFAQEARSSAARAAPRVSLVVTATLVPATAMLIIAAFAVSSGFFTGGLF